MADTHYFNACKLGPGNCEMGKARIRFTDTEVLFTKMTRKFWVDTGVNGKSYGDKGDYLIILHGVRRVVSREHFERNYHILEDE